MKLLLLPLLLVSAAARAYGLRPGADEAPPPAACDPAGCRVTVECTGHGTCLVTCFEDDGSIRCQEEVVCDQPCDQPCEAKGSCPR